MPAPMTYAQPIYTQPAPMPISYQPMPAPAPMPQQFAAPPMPEPHKPAPENDAPPGYRLAGYAPVPEAGSEESPGWEFVNNKWIYVGNQVWRDARVLALPDAYLFVSLFALLS